MNINEKILNSSLLLGALLLTSNVTGTYCNSSNKNIPVVREVRCTENNTAGAKYMTYFSYKNDPVFNSTTMSPKMDNKNTSEWFKEAIELFGEMRGFTKEESQIYEKSLSKLYIPTGDNFFDL